MGRRPFTDVEWRHSLQCWRMWDAQRKRLCENNTYRVLKRARNREARRRQRENPKFREQGARLLYFAEYSLIDFYGIIFCDVEAAVNRMLSYKLKKHRSCDL
ncbi:unnamed protein product [Cercopithifilaria johnstoni]|uniref:BZIP domain-containing protein n=1 Tax=Cercopithifilaria johnstoni TaxID=2874296 RepID=A0A8J2Q4M6_9BILA|nr:unnamed protein product [Cercopithifilaria johnstoni]